MWLSLGKVLSLSRAKRCLRRRLDGGSSCYQLSWSCVEFVFKSGDVFPETIPVWMEGFPDTQRICFWCNWVIWDILSEGVWSGVPCTDWRVGLFVLGSDWILQSDGSQKKQDFGDDYLLNCHHFNRGSISDYYLLLGCYFPTTTGDLSQLLCFVDVLWVILSIYHARKNSWASRTFRLSDCCVGNSWEWINALHLPLL